MSPDLTTMTGLMGGKPAKVNRAAKSTEKMFDSMTDADNSGTMDVMDSLMGVFEGITAPLQLLMPLLEVIGGIFMSSWGPTLQILAPIIADVAAWLWQFKDVIGWVINPIGMLIGLIVDFEGSVRSILPAIVAIIGFMRDLLILLGVVPAGAPRKSTRKTQEDFYAEYANTPEGRAAARGAFRGYERGLERSGYFHEGGTVPGVGERKITALGGEEVISHKQMRNLQSTQEETNELLRTLIQTNKKNWRRYYPRR